MKQKDFYEILGVDKKATKEEIKKVYKKLALEHHPDKGGDENKFKEINEAHSVLSDDKKRKHYDMYGNKHQHINHDDIYNQYRQYATQRRRSYFRGETMRINIKVSLEDVFNGLDKKIKFKRLVLCEDCEGKGGKNIKTCDVCNGQGFTITHRENGYMIIQETTTCLKCNGSGEIVQDLCNTCKGR